MNISLFLRWLPSTFRVLPSRPGHLLRLCAICLCVHRCLLATLLRDTLLAVGQRTFRASWVRVSASAYEFRKPHPSALEVYTMSHALRLSRLFRCFPRHVFLSPYAFEHLCFCRVGHQRFFSADNSSWSSSLRCCSTHVCCSIASASVPQTRTSSASLVYKSRRYSRLG